MSILRAPVETIIDAVVLAAFSGTLLFLAFG